MKKYIIKHIIPGVFLVFCHVLIYGQSVEENQEVRNFLDGMFQNLNKSKVPTGLLRDYAFELVELEKYNGMQISDENYLDRHAYEMLLRTIRSSAVGNKPFGNVKDILVNQYALGNSNVVSVSALAFKYSSIKSNALTNGLIRYENEKVYDKYVNGNWQNPYQQEYVTGLCLHTHEFSGTSLTFKLDGNMWFSNIPYQTIEIDAGNGYHQINPGGSITATFSSGGQKEIKLRVTLTNGIRLHSHTLLKLNYGMSLRSLGLNTPRYIASGTAYRGVTTSAEVYVRTRNGTIRNPLIIVEGFDPRSNQYPTGRTTAENFNNKLTEVGTSNNKISQNYDLIYVDWVNSEQYIQANANTLRDVINWVNSQKPSGSNATNVIWGESMGGLISRYALASMENDRIPHETSLYISYDAPHLGANVPLGTLYGLYGVISFLENQNTIGSFVNSNSGTLIEMAQNLAHCNAAKQMLVNYVDFAGHLNNYEHNLWQNELAQIGFPQGDPHKEFRMIGVANGSYMANDIPDSYLDANFSASSDITWLIPSISGAAIGIVLNDLWAGLLELVPGKTTIKGLLQINPGRYAGSKITDIELKYKKKFAWIANITRTIFSYEKNMHSGLTYDIFPSSRYDFGNINSGEKYQIPVVGKVSYNIDLATEQIPFLPTSSALCVGGGNGNLNSSMFTSMPGINDTPFGANTFVSPAASIGHIQLNENILEWIIAQIDLGITGPKHGVSDSQYSVINAPSNISWSSTNPSIASINQSGQLTVSGKGIVTITATTNNNITVSKKIMVGTPNFILENVSREPGFFCIKAKCIDNQSGYADFVKNNTDIIVYKWGVKNGNEAIKWITSNSPELHLSTLEDTENTSIYLKTIDQHGNESSPLFKRITGYDIYDIGFPTLVFNSQGKMYSSTGTRLYYDYITMPLTIRQSSIPEFTNAKWSPVAAVVVDEDNVHKGIPWERNGYIRDIISQSDKENILSLTDNSVIIYRLMLLNFDREIIQKTPITIMYKANFP